MKYEWRRQEKQLYGAKTTPALVTVPTQSCIMINGEGNPNDTDFSNRVSALYSVAYAVKMAYKKTAKGEYDDFAVYPLEGVWQKIENCELIKEKLRYTLVIRQPDFVGEDGVCAALERTKHRKPNPLLEEVRAYDDEPVSFAKMDEFVHAHSLARTEEGHREIYLSNATRTEKNRLKTILRYRVK